jgi:hypothetical protein
MATTKPQKAKAPVVAKAAVTQTVTAPKAARVQSDLPFIFDRDNYIIMAAGIAVIVIGFALMTGPANDNPSVFPADEIYSFRRTSLAPVVVFLGFLIEVYAILKRPKTV